MCNQVIVSFTFFYLPVKYFYLFSTYFLSLCHYMPYVKGTTRFSLLVSPGLTFQVFANVRREKPVSRIDSHHLCTSSCATDNAY